MEFVEVLAGATIALAATSAGAAGIFAFRKMDAGKYAAIMSFCAGVMAFSAFEMLSQAHRSAGDATVFGGLLLGLAAFFVIERLLPHAHFALRKKGMNDSKRKVALLAGTVTLHNVPEGFAIASAFASSPALGWLVTTSIALQDVPEGLVVSAPIASYGMDNRRSFLLGVFSGVVEFAGAILGFLFLSAVAAITPLALSFAGGAMAYVTFFEMLPDAFRAAGAKKAAFWLALGVVLAFAMALLFNVAY